MEITYNKLNKGLFPAMGETVAGEVYEIRKNGDAYEVRFYTGTERVRIKAFYADGTITEAWAEEV